MHTRLIPVLLSGLLGATLVLAQQPPGQLPGQPGTPPGGQPGKTDQNDRPVGMASIEGNWTVVSAARDGRAVDGADKMTVTIKGDVVTFDGGADKNPMRAMRLDFGPAGNVRVMEANPDGKFDTPGTPGVGTPPPAGKDLPPDRPPPSITPSPPGGVPQSPRPDPRPGDTTDRRVGMPGVYVLTPDYLAISVFEPGYASGTPPAGGVRPGGAGTPPGTGIPPAGTTPPVTGTPPAIPPGGVGASGTGTQPPAAIRPGDTVAPLGGAGAAGQPQMRSHVSVILKRDRRP